MPLRNFQSQSNLEKPRATADTNAIIAVLLFIFGLSLLGSRFVGSPGITIQLPQTEHQSLQATTGVLNLGINNMVIFDGKRVKIDHLEPIVRRFLSRQPSKNVTILVLADAWAPLQSVVAVFDILKKSGCSQIQIACEAPEPLRI
ncbi:MAG: biopolymer transporter ExbD [Verrucomicrobiota bacterium]|nr:MAG: biopolymer transporter ExbD [Verrucomicrobiota bacterium]